MQSRENLIQIKLVSDLENYCMPGINQGILGESTRNKSQTYLYSSIDLDTSLASAYALCGC